MGLVFVVSGGEDFGQGPETKLDNSELLCSKILLEVEG